MKRIALLILALTMIPFASKALAQQMMPLKGHVPDRESLQRNLVDATAMPESRQLVLQIVLRVHNKDAWAKLIDEQNDPDSPNYRHHFSDQELASNFGPSASDYQVVENWLTSHGFQILSVDDSFLSRSIRFTGTAAQVKSTLQVQLMQSRDGNSFSNTTDPQVPENLAGLIGYIGGLSNVTGSGSGPHTITPASGPQSKAMPFTVVNNQAGFAPPDMYSFYSENPLINAGFTGTGQSIAIVGLSDFLPGAVTAFDMQFTVPAAVINRPILVDGTDPNDHSVNETEALLDIEWAHAAATGATINFYLGDPNPNNTSTGNGIVDAIQRAVNDDTCGTISVSFEICGFSLAFYESTVDPILMKARTQGQQVFIITDDFGAAAPVVGPSGMCVAGTTLGVSELAADPNSIAVGGSQPTAIPTSGSVAGAGFTPEQVFNTTGSSTPLASGGGVSQAFSKPNYQLGLTPNDGQRDIPDVSLFSALTFTTGSFSGVFIGQDQNGAGVIFCCQIGTSIAAPLWAGIGAVMQQRSGARLSSNFNAQIYTLGRLNTAAGFRDVKTGTNTFNGVNGFPALQGYDQATGWGSADITTFVNTFVFGRGLAASGIKGASTTITTADIYTPTSLTAGTFSSGGTFVDSRESYGANSLPDGTILVFGGVVGSTAVKTAGIYDPAHGTFTLLSAKMPEARETEIHATLLFTGKVFIAGRDDTGQYISTVLYDPVAKSFASGPSQIAPPKSIHALGYTETLLANGRVLIQGGTTVSQIYDPILNSFSRTVGQPKIANRMNANSVLLADGRVLIAGGDVGITPTATAEVYDPVTDSYTQVGNMTEARVTPPLLAISTGKVLVMGSDTKVDLFDPSANTFSATGQMQVARGAYGFSRLNNGTVLVAGGSSSSGNLTSAEIYDPVAGTFTLTGSMTTARSSNFDFAIK